MKRLITAASIGLLVVLVGVGAALTGTACSENPVGTKCYIGEDASVDNAAIIASPALECQSRTCLHMPSNDYDLCTGECSDSSDCDGTSVTPCLGGFECIVPVTVGPFCCKKYCVCRDYLGNIPDGGVRDPAACDPTNAVNECCNLDGRRSDLTRYPGCK